jgi:hypothetical protein
VTLIVITDTADVDSFMTDFSFLYSRVSQPGFRELSLGDPREIVIEQK